MSTDNYKKVLYNDGEGVVYSDLNDQQNFFDAKIWDQIIHNAIGNFSANSTLLTSVDPPFSVQQDGTDHLTRFAYCLNPGTAYLRKGSANNKIQLAPGVLFQKLAVLTGNDNQIASYLFAGTEEWTLANGDATNPRVDLLEMKLEWINTDLQSRDFEDATTRIVTTSSLNKKRRVQCTLQVKQGTPAASPTIPEPDTGFVPVGTAVVGQTWTSAGNAPIFGVDTTSSGNVVIHDQRMPIVLKAYTVDPMLFRNVSNWTLTNNQYWSSTVSANNELMVPCPATNLGRLMYVSVCHDDTNSGSLQYEIGQSTQYTTTSYVKRAAITTSQSSSPTTSVVDDQHAFWNWEAFGGGSGVGPVIQPSVTTNLGLPIWSNGRRCPYEKFVTAGPGGQGTVRREHVVVRFVNIFAATTTTRISHVTFWFAEGLL